MFNVDYTELSFVGTPPFSLVYLLSILLTLHLCWYIREIFLAILFTFLIFNLIKRLLAFILLVNLPIFLFVPPLLEIFSLNLWKNATSERA